MAAAVPSLTPGRSPFTRNQGNQTSGLEVCAGMAMTDPNISWQRTFPESEPGTDGVALFEGSHDRPHHAHDHPPTRPEAVVVERHRPGARRAAGLGQHARRNALAPA